MALLVASLVRLFAVSAAALSLTWGSFSYLLSEVVAHIEAPQPAASSRISPVRVDLPRLPAQAFDIAAAIPVSPDIPAVLDQRSWPGAGGADGIAAAPPAAVTLEEGRWADIGNGISVWERAGASEDWTLVGSAD